jgi:hypothetical protein
MSVSQNSALCIASTTLLDAGYSPVAVGRAMLALENDEPTADILSDPAEWEPGPEPGFEPSQEDIEFLNAPGEPDWDESARIAEWQDRLEQMHRYGDDDLRAAGLPVG